MKKIYVAIIMLVVLAGCSNGTTTQNKHNENESAQFHPPDWSRGSLESNNKILQIKNFKYPTQGVNQAVLFYDGEGIRLSVNEAQLVVTPSVTEQIENGSNYTMKVLGD